MDSQLEIIVRESGLEQNRAKMILERFQDYSDVAAQWEATAKTIVVTDESQTDLMKLARTGRLALREKRIAIERMRKELKEQPLREGQAIDKIANALKGLMTPTEEYLEKQEKFAEIRAAERAKEEARLEQEEKDWREKARLEQEEKERQRLESERVAEDKRKAAEIARLKVEAEERERKAEKDRQDANKKLADERSAREEAARKADLEIEALVRKAQVEQDALELKAKADRDRQARLLAEKESRIRVLMNQDVVCPHCGGKFKLT